jgi:hypothetical protein
MLGVCLLSPGKLLYRMFGMQFSASADCFDTVDTESGGTGCDVVRDYDNGGMVWVG